jgi:hypothetical protein
MLFGAGLVALNGNSVRSCVDIAKRHFETVKLFCRVCGRRHISETPSYRPINGDLPANQGRTEVIDGKD